MGKHTKSKNSERIGKGKVTPVQIAFIVDRYLSDNAYNHTRTAFRSEASHLIAKSPVQEAPKSLLSLGAILDEYITLKEQKVWLDQERCRMDQEKLRAENLLRGMQDAINAYSGAVNQVVTPAGYCPVQSNRAAIPASGVQTYSTNITTTPVTSHTTTIKRKGSNTGHVSEKRSRSCTRSQGVSILAETSNVEKNRVKVPMNSGARSTAVDGGSNRSAGQGSNVAKCLFNQKPQTPSASCSVPKTPPLGSSSQTDVSVSPFVMHSSATSSKAVTTPQKIMSTNCTITETIRVSPNKQVAYYSVERNQCLSTCSPVKGSQRSSNVKDRVKGRLDFGASDVPVITEGFTNDGSSTSESEKEGDVLDLDFPNLDALGWDFNLSQLLVDFGIASEGLNLSPDSDSGSPPTSGNVVMDDQQVTSQFSSTMTGVLGDKDMNLVGPDSIAAMRSVRQCIIMSPVKSQRNNLDQENL